MIDVEGISRVGGERIDGLRLTRSSLGRGSLLARALTFTLGNLFEFLGTGLSGFRFSPHALGGRTFVCHGLRSLFGRSLGLFGACEFLLGL